MKLRNKLLYSFILATLILVTALFFMLRWSFERGAATYVKQEDQQDLRELSIDLAAYYAEHQTWDAFVQDSQKWYDWLAHHKEKSKSESPNHSTEDQPRTRPQRDTENLDSQSQHPSPRMGSKPFFLLDSSQKALIGRFNTQGTLTAITLKQATGLETVGYVGLPPPPARLQKFWHKPLVEKQSELLLYFALGALLISIIAAIPLSAHWTKRIKRLHEHVKTLSDGHYENRISLSGKDEISGLGEHLNQLAIVLGATLKQRQQMTADISHELRTPVANLQANIEAMQDDILPLTQESLAQLNEQVHRLKSLINDLHQLALSDAGAIKYHFSDCDIRQLLQQLLGEFQASFQGEKLTLTLELDDTKNYRVLADEERLNQLFCNLLENSKRYTHSPGVVKISVQSLDEDVVITVSDSSPGVDAKHHPYLTDRLFRVDHSRNRSSGGSGLGLNLCLSIVQAHKGDLKFSSSPLGGLTVTVKLPKQKHKS